MTDTAKVAPAVPAYRYGAAMAAVIEPAWQQRWADEAVFAAPNPVGSLSSGFDAVAGRPKKFVMDMFPYPSGEGLHVGHPLGYVSTDVYARYQRMNGHTVLHTMGFDAFGLPAEQHAVETGRHPRTLTERNISIYREQLRQLGMDHDPRRSVSTIDPSYYRWTQWIFLQLFGSWYDVDADRARPIADLLVELDAGEREPAEGTNPGRRPWPQLSDVDRGRVVDAHRLAYLHQAPVNWCPGLGTVLSNEEVTADGRSERGNFPVFRRPLRQWMLRITAYSDRLLADLDLLDWPDSIKLQQRNWIGRSTGAYIAFGTDHGGIEVFTTRPDTVFGATYLVLAPEHPMVGALTATAWPDGVPASWTDGAARPGEAVAAYQLTASRRSELDRQTEGREKTGVFTGAYAHNPATGRAIPVFVADYVLMGYGTGAIMAVPGQDQRDWDFAEAFDLPILRTVAPPEDFDGQAYTGAGPAIGSGFLNGLEVDAAKVRIIEWLVRNGHGRSAVTYKLRDWLFSRQRYWGEPFPIVYDDDGMPHAVPDGLLPVSLPDVDDYSPRTFPDGDVTGEPETPLSRATDWVTVELDLGAGVRSYRRDTNTMPNWAGSCWYELRYADPDNDTAACDPEIERYWMGPRDDNDCGGVDLYVGGAEHAVLHLLYARFWHKVLFDLGYVSSREPFRKLVNQGMIQSPAYADARGFYVEASEVERRGTEFFFHGEPVRQEFGKVGKSLKNVITPDAMIAKYGADTFRLYEMFTGPLEQSRPWDPQAVSGMYRLLQRIWRNVIDETTGESRVSTVDREASTVDDDTRRLMHRTIDAVRDGYETLRFNTSIARITELSNRLTQRFSSGVMPAEVAEPLVLMLAPLSPHVAEEMWSRMGHQESLAWRAFPVADPDLLGSETVQIAVQVNGKLRATVTVASDANATAMESAARAEPRVTAQLDGATVRKVIAVPGRLVNFVVG
ncbi:MAG: leucine--tRNA ligase [Mycobacteriales bacterium]|nr:MAG: leucine--tRNA ligase [Pseudonocardiales bacterium]